VANGVLPSKRCKRVRSKYLSNKTYVFVQTSLFAIGDGNTSGFLASML
jgi:hypothetical protein